MSEPENPQPTEPADATRRIAWWWWAIGAALVVVALVLAIVLTRSDDASTAATGTASTATVRETISPSKGSPPDPSSSPTAGEEATTAPDEPTGEPAPTQTVPVDEEGTPEAGVTAAVSKIEAVEGTAELPGEVGGPSLRVTVQIDNETGSELDLSFAVVNLYYGADLKPALPLGQPGVEPFPGSVDAGRSASGTYVFNVPVDERDDITIELDLSVDSTVVLFRGPAGV
jgi:hypothetical protein